MPRRARLEIPGIPVHIIQRGVNRGAVFVDDVDRRHYLDLLGRTSRARAMAVHAYVLMDNHVHLLASTQEHGALAASMRRLGQCYAQAFNRRHRRTGPLWEGRFKSCLVDSEGYLLSVYRYIERNPVRAAISERPEHYRWSSARGNLGLGTDALLTPHPVFVALDADPVCRTEAYRDWLEQATGADDLKAIRSTIAQQKALGNPRFQAMVREMLGRPVAVCPLGRPAKAMVDQYR